MDDVAVEDEVELTNIGEGTIESFNKDLNQVQNAQFRLAFITAENKVERRVMSIDELAVGCGIHEER